MATVVPQNESVCFAKPLYVCMYARIGFVTSFVAAPTTTRFVVKAPPPFTTKLRPWKSIPTTETFEKSGFLFEPP